MAENTPTSTTNDVEAQREYLDHKDRAQKEKNFIGNPLEGVIRKRREAEEAAKKANNTK